MSSSGIGIIYNITLLIYLQKFISNLSIRHISLIIGLILVLIASAIWATVDNYTLYKSSMLVLKLLPISVLGYIAGRYSDSFYRSFKLQLIFVFCVIVIFGYANGLAFDINHRLDIGDINPIWISRILCITILAIYMDHRFFSVLPMLAALPLILMSGSKGPVLALIICILIWEKINWKFFLWICLISSIVVFAVSTYTDDAFFNYLVQRFFRLVPDGSDIVLTRPYIIGHGLTQFSEQNVLSILFGLGLGDSGELFQIDRRFYPHNIFLEILFENGVFTICILIIFILSIFNTYYSNKTKIFFIYFLVNSFFSGDLITNEIVFFFLFFFDRKQYAN